MKRAMVLFTVVLGLVLIPILPQAQGRGDGKAIGLGGSATARTPYNPKPFQNNVASPSGIIRFLLSEPGKQLLRTSPNPKGREFLKSMGVDDRGTASPRPTRPRDFTLAPPPSGRGRFAPTTPGTVTGCGTSFGKLFNREPAADALPQNEQSVDLLRTRGFSGSDLLMQGSNDLRGIVGLLGNSLTGYYVDRNGDCAPDFEGGLPTVQDPFEPGTFLFGGGDPVVVADPTRDAIFMADLRFDGTTTGIGVFRTNRSNLLNTTRCPAGSHTEFEADACWGVRRVLNPLPPFAGFFQDKPHMAVDSRSSGVGAGNVYVTATEFNFFAPFFSRIWLVSCATFLGNCSPPVLVSGSETNTQFSHVAVRPGGGITVTYINVTGFDAFGFFQVDPLEFDIKYVTCTPAVAPASPSCSPATLVVSEKQPLEFGGFLAAQDFRIATYPKHDHRVDANGTETYIVWDRCKHDDDPLFGERFCADTDVRMAASNNNGGTWTLTTLAGGPQDQFFPWIKTDPSTNIVNIVFYSSGNDPAFQHRVQIFLRHIAPGPATPDAADFHVITTLLNDPSGDPFFGGFFFGDYIGVAARGSRAYIGFTYNNLQGTYSGIPTPEQNNHMSRFDF